jgi:hypothetical protein
MKEPVIDPELEKFFQSVHTVPGRRPGREMEGKKAFLHEARTLEAAVSKAADSRLNQRTYIGKERIPMWKIAGALMIAVSTLFGGAVVAGAQEAMPEDGLYPVKTWSEEVRLLVEGDPLSKMDLALEFADRRAEEIVHQIDAGLPVTDAIIARLMNEDDLALAIAAQAGDAKAPAALEKVRARLEEHLRVLDYLQAGIGSNENALLLQTRQNIRQRLELLNGDLNDQQLRVRILEQVRDRENQPWITPAGQTNQSPNGNADASPGAGAGSDSGNGNPATEGTAGSGNGDAQGQGPGQESTCVCPNTCGGQGAGANGKGTNGDATPNGLAGEDGCVCPTIICTPQKGNQHSTGNP